MAQATPGQSVMRINHYLTPCEGVGVRLCMLAQTGDAVGSNDWEYFYEQIAGFTTYRLGYTYDLVIAMEQVKRPPQDASSVGYTLVTVQSERRVKPATRFDLALMRSSGESYVTGDAHAGFALLDSIKIACTPDLCGQLSRRMTAGTEFTGTFVHSEQSEHTIVLQSLSQ